MGWDERRVWPQDEQEKSKVKDPPCPNRVPDRIGAGGVNTSGTWGPAQETLRAMLGVVRSGRGATAMDVLDLQHLLWGTVFGDLNHGAA